MTRELPCCPASTCVDVSPKLAGSGAAIGLLLGGALTQYVDWRWCMYVNAVFAAVAFVGASLLLPAPKEGVSNRERFAMHTSNPACSGCHNLIDGLGFGYGSEIFRLTDAERDEAEDREEDREERQTLLDVGLRLFGDLQPGQRLLLADHRVPVPAGRRSRTGAADDAR